ncbi:MAG: hypothetical protein IT330_08805 [Anaerolineae bacterium]|nr:hypothetical protein [Anaerolineae bacterium]
MASVRTSFSAQQHGFRFVNRFALLPSRTISLPGIGSIDLSSVVVGLCGGMSFAALDYFRAGKPAPSQDTIPEVGTALHTYLVQRQLRSFQNLQPGILPLPAIVWFIEWTLAPNSTVEGLTARQEAPKLRRKLDQGEPAVLGLIRSNALDRLHENHQVVAAGYDLDEMQEQLTIHVYDPNHPGMEPEINVNLRGSDEGILPNQSTGEPLRGFFVINYTPRKSGLPAA